MCISFRWIRLYGGKSISELNQGLKTLEEELKKDDTASQRVQLLVIRLGDDDKATILTDWTDAIDFKAPSLEAYGRTPWESNAISFRKN